ncbi:hypothetical protein FA95DRAFT_1560569 [Auriscalpium vulgare]|uniref:Uncharacterized protein n=1 Tax=Auriscalpium vulgare TaxID=40419 RepID=A0ACB8RR42_9AGAM|nr:hypothetical protein FA95DRAFT_1560569 [Auriscalpium vulgare]
MATTGWPLVKFRDLPEIFGGLQDAIAEHKWLRDHGPKAPKSGDDRFRQCHSEELYEIFSTTFAEATVSNTATYWYLTSWRTRSDHLELPGDGESGAAVAGAGQPDILDPAGAEASKKRPHEATTGQTFFGPVAEGDHGAAKADWPQPPQTTRSCSSRVAAISR